LPFTSRTVKYLWGKLLQKADGIGLHHCMDRYYPNYTSGKEKRNKKFWEELITYFP
jgi:hypothetical protein